MTHENPKARTYRYVILRHTGLPARVYKARETKRCGECLQPIKAGLLYTLRAPRNNRRAHEPRCYGCVPYVALEDAATVLAFTVRQERQQRRGAA